MARFLVSLVVLACVASCAKETPAPAPLGLAALDAAEKARVAKAKTAAKAFGTRLLTRLTEAVGEGGLPAAIAVCKTDAPRIAAEVGEERGVAIGRTSLRLRNPASAPSDWAAAHLAAPAAAKGPLATRLPDGRLGVTFPIPTKKMCLGCHGEPEAIPEEVRSRLAEDYPDDAATGFAEGDLRGLFWVEVG